MNHVTATNNLKEKIVKYAASVIILLGIGFSAKAIYEKVHETDEETIAWQRIDLEHSVDDLEFDYKVFSRVLEDNKDKNDREKLIKRIQETYKNLEKAKEDLEDFELIQKINRAKEKF